MRKKQKPTGFVAICQCGKTVGALDYNRTDVKDVSKIISVWLMDGLAVVPKLGSEWTVKLEICTCND